MDSHRSHNFDFIHFNKDDDYNKKIKRKDVIIDKTKISKR